jgi:hypothetical protein
MQDSRSTFGSVLTQVQHLLKTLATVATSLKSYMIKRTQKERDQEANANSGRNLSKQNSR